MILIIRGDIPGIPILTGILKRLKLVPRSTEGFRARGLVNQASDFSGCGIEGDAEMVVFERPILGGRELGVGSREVGWRRLQPKDAIANGGNICRGH